MTLSEPSERLRHIFLSFARGTAKRKARNKDDLQNRVLNGENAIASHASAPMLDKDGMSKAGTLTGGPRQSNWPDLVASAITAYQGHGKVGFPACNSQEPALKSVGSADRAISL